MPQVGIVTDSVNCLPPELISQYRIRVGPVGFIIDGQAYRDQIDITADEFFGRQKSFKDIPTTSGVNAGDFLNIFRDLAESTDSIACFTMSKEFSVTYDSALQARELLKKENPDVNVEIVSTQTALGAEGFVVLEAARAAEAGQTLPQVTAAAHELIPRVKWIAALDNLRYLIKGGRAPRVAGMFGDLIQMKPIVGIVSGTGKVDFVDKVRTKGKALPRMIELARTYLAQDKPAQVIVHYSNDIEDGRRLKELVASELNCRELYMSQASPVACCHTGPMVGLAFHS